MDTDNTKRLPSEADPRLEYDPATCCSIDQCFVDTPQGRTFTATRIFKDGGRFHSQLVATWQGPRGHTIMMAAGAPP